MKREYKDLFISLACGLVLDIFAKTFYFCFYNEYNLYNRLLTFIHFDVENLHILL